MTDGATPLVVLGGAGRVGARLIDLAIESQPGRPLVNVDCAADVTPVDHVVSLHGDVAHPSEQLLRSLLEMPGFDLVVLSALITDESDGARRAEEVFDVNCVGAVRLAWSCRERIRKVVFSSSVEVYGQPIDGAPFREEQHLAPTTSYGISKLVGERTLIALCGQLRVPCVTLRFTSIYGSRPPLGNALEAFVERAGRGDDLHVFGDGSARRDFVHVDDAARSILAALQYPESDVFNIAHPQALTLKELARLAVQECGGGKVVHVPEPWPLVHRVMDVSRMLGALDFHPEIATTEGISRMMEW